MKRYLIVTVQRNRHRRVLVLHVDRQATDLRQRVGEITEVLEQNMSFLLKETSWYLQPTD